MKLRFLVSCVALLLRPALSSAQATVPQDQSQVIQNQAARIDQLDKRVAELEAEKRAPAATPNAAQASQPASSMDATHGQSQGEAQDTHPSLKFAGFSDVMFSDTDQPGTHSGFTEGQFILHINSTLSNKVSFMSELSFTARADAGTGTPAAAGFNVEVERSIIRFEHNDLLKLSFGRYHTPINYWNTTFHHGQWLQTTVSRPEMIQFGGRFLPVHFVGALVEGTAPAKGLNFNYNFGVGNGRGAVISRSGDAGDINNNRAWLANVFVRPGGLYGLQVGASVYRDKITVVGSQDVREWISSAHFVWQRENPELIAEFANVNHEVIGAATVSNSQAYYIQVAYRLPILEKLWKPYYRFEYIHVPKSDSVFQQVASVEGSTVGVRYDLSSLAALKFEYRNQLRAPIVQRINGVFAQMSFTF